MTVSQPQLWSLEERNLYKLVTEVRAGGEIVDRYETRFGIRSIEIRSRRRDCFLNGKPVKVKGTCNHQDHAGWARRCPTPCSTTACASCRRWAATACAPRTIRPRRSCSMPATSWACWSSMRRA